MFKEKSKLVSCDTFVVLPEATATGGVIFAKNSDRPKGEVQDLVYESPKQWAEGDKLKCTYLEVEQVRETLAVILSKPSWMWGCEMGANSAGVVVGNEAVWTKVESSDDSLELLTGMDLVRLALERAGTAQDGVTIITTLLEKYGQGGPCSEDDKDWAYHNSFLLADPKEAWVLETAGRHWAAQKVATKFCNISNGLTIQDKYDKISENAKNYAKEKGFWSGDGDFNFSAVFGTDTDSVGRSGSRYSNGKLLLEQFSNENKFTVANMFELLRDEKSGICRGVDDAFPTAGSQVSLLLSDKPCCHWFTATPDPSNSVFKPFIFTPNVKISSYTVSQPIESTKRKHTLLELQEKKDNKPKQLLRDMEAECLSEVEKFLQDYTPGQSLTEVDDLLKDIVETEAKFYK